MSDPMRRTLEEQDDAIHSIRERLVALESDMRWVKWAAMAAAAAGVSNLFLNARPVQAVVVGAVMFAITALIDAVTHLK